MVRCRVLPFAVLTALACRGAGGPVTPGAAPGRPPVPAVAPDHVPEEIYADTNVTSHSPDVIGSVVKNVVLVGFRAGTPQVERQAAIDLVRGEVIGGRRVYLDVGDGWYVVRVPSDSLARGVFAALRKLRALPQVDFAQPELLGCVIPEGCGPAPRVAPRPPSSRPSGLTSR